MVNIDYSSRKYTIRELADKIHPQIEKFIADKTKPVHFVGHSMGGLVIRAYVARHPPENMGRVVFLGPPSHGSEVADFLKNWFLYKGFCGPAGQELTTGRDYDALLGKVSYDLGIIAGDRSLDPVSSLLISGDNDGKVSVESTKLAAMKDHIVIHATHTFMMKNADVIRQTRYFIEHGAFKKQPS